MKADGGGGKKKTSNLDEVVVVGYGVQRSPT